MINLEEYGFTKAQIETFAKKNIYTMDGLLRTMPIRYYNFSKTYQLSMSEELREKIDNKIPVAITGILRYVNYEYKPEKRMSLTTMKVEDATNRKYLYISVFGAYKMTKYYESCLNKEVIVGGRLNYSAEYNSFSMASPVVFSEDIEKFKRMLPVYHKYKGITEESFANAIKTAAGDMADIDYMPLSVINEYNLSTHKETCRLIHFPKSKEDLIKAGSRILIEDMLYFCCKQEEADKQINMKSHFVVNSLSSVNKLKSLLPFELTKGQYDTVGSLLKKAHEGQRISALIQGDVGSGKTIVAFLMMVAFAEAGYQSVLMAPTGVLATQHYEDLKEKLSLIDEYGFKVALLTSETKTKQRKEILKGIREGEYQFVVGTHSLIGKDVEYKDLALTITDEEHKFGVLQREALVEKGQEGVHNMIMSATPIPRTLAKTIYGSNTDVCQIELPKGRKPVITKLCDNQDEIYGILEREIKKGQQAYIVCPLIEKNDEKMAGVQSVEELERQYKNYFERRGIKVSAITGKTNKDEQKAILDSFKENRTSILIATTVIEVGINVPNASIIVITGAERFGLATLQQLRGRVGRGNIQSYCILQKSLSAEAIGQNLAILCSTNDGLEIAKADLLNRGSGNIIGIEQSGTNKHIENMLAYPKTYNDLRRMAKILCNDRTAKEFINAYEEMYV